MTRILIADDLSQNRYLLVALLQGHGYEVVAAEDGAQALALAQRSPPDLLITDVLMPVMDGFELCRQWKQDDRLRHVPFIIYTATYTDAKDERLALSLGADRFVIKPQKVEVLLKIVREVLEDSDRDPHSVRAGQRGEDVEMLRLHNEALMRKLEHKVRQLEAELEERKQLVEQLQEERDRWQTTFDAMLDPVCQLAPDGTVARFNRAFAGFVGRDSEGVIGQRCSLLVHGSDDNVEGCPLVRARRSGRRETMELDVGDRSYLVVVDPITAGDGPPIGFVHVLRDLTAQKRAEDELRRTNSLLESVIENIPDMVFLKDARELRLLRVNRAGEALLGYSRAGLLGKSDYDVFPKAQADFFTRKDREALQGKAVVDIPEELIQSKEMGERVLRTKKVPILNAKGEAEYLLGISEDITERKRADHESQQLQRQLMSSQKLESIGRLAGGVAHDFNNLLTVVLGHTGFALAGVREGDPLRADLEEIRMAGERGAALTRQLLAFSRNQILEPEVLSVNDLVARMESMLRRLLGEDIAIEVRLDRDLGNVMADPGRIEQIIMNLAVNARDAMPRGGKLTLESANVELDEGYASQHVGVNPGPFVVLSVTDSGCGMDAAILERIFDPFFTTKEKGKGTGLGLSIAYGIVKQSGGNIWVYSEPGQGTSFRVYLPRVDAVAAKAKRRLESVRSTRGERVLLVEDEEAVRKVAERILRRAGYEVRAAASGSAALLACENPDGRIDLLLTDVVMPEMSGPDLADLLAKHFPGLKTLYMSGYTDHAIVLNGVLAPGTRFISKPFSAAELTRKVRNVLDEQEAEDA